MEKELFEELEAELLSNGYKQGDGHLYFASDGETGILIEEGGLRITDADGSPLETRFELSLDGVDDALWCVKKVRLQNLVLRSDFFEKMCQGRRAAL